MAFTLPVYCVVKKAPGNGAVTCNRPRKCLALSCKYSYANTEMS